MNRLFNRSAKILPAVLLVAGGAYAQTQDSNPRPADAGAPAVVGNEAKHAREADARHCLSLNNERAIIRCAEPYRYRGATRTRQQ